jgi:isopentenyl phosphate kinase
LEDRVVIKLGGSFLSQKSREFSVRKKELDAVCSILGKFGGGMAIVHGGGSFGHPLAKRYGLSSSKVSPTAEGVSETREAMQRLSSIVCDSLQRAGVRTYVLPAVSLLDLKGEEREDIEPLLNIVLSLGLSPLTYGDVSVVKGGFTIVSGDLLSYILCRAIRPSRMVFVIDLPGVLKDTGDPDSLITELEPSGLSRYAGSVKDATGGFAYKLGMAAKIASLGIDTCIVSGFDEDALISSLKGGQFRGTLVKGKR